MLKRGKQLNTPSSSPSATGKVSGALPCPEPPYIRVVDIQKPVEAHVHTKGNVDQVIVLLLQSVINGGQAVNDLQNIHWLVILFEVVLVQGIACSRQTQEIHCWNKKIRNRKDGRETVVVLPTPK